jgi:cytoskeleton protein RodZ
MAVPAAPAAATPTPDDPRRRAGEGSPSANAPAALSAAAPLPGQEGVARRLSTVTERPGISAVVPAAPPAPVPATAVTVPATAAAPADEPLADEDEDADAPPPPPTPRAAASPDAARGTGELTITSLPPSAAPSPSAPATAAPPVPAVPAPAGQSFGATAEPSRITVRADIDSWVQVTTTGGQPVFARMLRAGDQYLVPNRAGLRLMTGNGGGLRITVDGNPTPPIGTLGSVVRDVALEPERLLRGNATANETPGG